MDRNWHKKSLAEMGFENNIPQRGAKVGAGQKQATLQFRPHIANTGFGGARAAGYSHYVDMEFDHHDYSWFVITFSMYRVRVKGFNLRSHIEAVADFREDVVIQHYADEMQAAGEKGSGQPVIYFMALEALEE